MTNKADSSVWASRRQHKTVKEIVVYELVDAMLDGRLRIDSPMPPEQEMCNRLGVSRVAFREAVKQLEVLGFLKIDRGNGTLVKTPTFSCLEPIIEFLGKAGEISFEDLHNVRLLVEVEAVRLIALCHDEKLIVSLQKVVDEVEANFDEESSHIDLDYKFHETLLEACPNKLLTLMLEPFSAQLRKSRRLSFKSVEASKETFKMHKAILEAVKSGDSVAAAKIMTEHIKGTAKDLKIKTW